MEAASKPKIAELQAIMTKMSLEVCCVTALPEFGVKWCEVSKAVRNARLPMTSASVARVICRHVAKSLPAEDVEDIVARLRLKLVATQCRTWHLIKLSGRESDEPVATLVRCLPGRLRQALKTGRGRNMTPEVQTVLLGSLVYVSARLRDATRSGPALYAALPVGEDSVLVSSLAPAALVKALVAGLGYNEYTDARLHGSDIPSLLRIASGAHAERQARVAEYRPRVALARHGLDYTGRAYDETYLDEVLGPDPPLLSHLNIETSRPFFDPSRLDKRIRLNVSLRSADVARSLRAWVTQGALSPAADLFGVFHQLRANKVTYTREDDE